MKNPLVKQILGAIALAVAIAAFSGIYGDFLYPTPDQGKPNFTVAKSDDEGGDAGKAKKPAGPEPISALLAAADAEKGESLAKKKCGACHNMEEGAGNKVGPNLYDVVGRAKASAEGFGYSDAMTAFGGDWSYEELNSFLYKPKAYIKGTKMGFAGFKKTDDRANVIAYLRSLSTDPAPLP